MNKISVINKKGEKTEEIILNEKVFIEKPNDAVLYDAIKLSKASLKQGTHSTKTRGEVRGGGRKPWRQKGTGRARHGSNRSPIWVGGGVVFGPQPRKYNKKMNKKERRLALLSALSYKVIGNELIVIDNLELDSYKTKDVINILKDIGISNEKLLIIVSELSDNLILATRNLQNIMILEVSEINTLDIISADKMIITVSALEKLEEANI